MTSRESTVNNLLRFNYTKARAQTSPERLGLRKGGPTTVS